MGVCARRARSTAEEAAIALSRGKYICEATGASEVIRMRESGGDEVCRGAIMGRILGRAFTLFTKI